MLLEVLEVTPAWKLPGARVPGAGGVPGNNMAQDGIALLFLSALCAGLGNSLDPISALSFVSPALALGSLARLMPPSQFTGGSPGEG